MTRRTTAAGLTLLLLTPAAAACTPSTASSADNGAAVSATSTADLPDCTPIYPGTDNSGITVTHGTVTGSMMLTCDPVPVSGQIFQVTIGLAYLSGDPDTASRGEHTVNGYQDTYTATAPCKPGVWAIVAVLDGTTGGHLPAPSTVTITNCTQDLS
jgi:hypothetical protein